MEGYFITCSANIIFTYKKFKRHIDIFGLHRIKVSIIQIIFIIQSFISECGYVLKISSYHKCCLCVVSLFGNRCPVSAQYFFKATETILWHLLHFVRTNYGRLCKILSTPFIINRNNETSLPQFGLNAVLGLPFRSKFHIAPLIPPSSQNAHCLSNITNSTTELPKNIPLVTQDFDQIERVIFSFYFNTFEFVSTYLQQKNRIF